MARKRHPLFTNESRMVDRFGLLTFVTVASIVMLMLVNIDPTVKGTLRQWESALASVLVAVTLMLALRASGLSRRYQRVVDVIVVVIVVFMVSIAAIQTLGDSVPATAVPAPFLVVALAVTAPLAVIARLVRHREITRGTLLGAVSGYLLIAIAFFYLFLAQDETTAGRFFGDPEPTQSFMYFSLATITTTGYGDLTAQSDMARLLATSEAVIGQIYLVTFVAMIVGLFIAGRQTFRLAGDPDASGDESASS